MNKTFRKIGTTMAGIALAMGLTTSCSNGDWEDDIEGGTSQGGNKGKTSVYFSMQEPIRTITLGNDDDANNSDDNNHQFKVQATLGGVYTNSTDRKISYVVDASLLPSGSGMEVLPESYYTLDNAETLTIPSGRIVGGTYVRLTDAFFNDPKSATTNYVLPVRLVASQTGDSIIEEKNYQLLCVKFKNQYSGMYCKTGTSTVQGLKAINHKNEDQLDIVSTTSLNVASVTFTYPVQEYDANGSLIDVTRDVALSLAFNEEGKCDVLQNGIKIGEGTFAPRGIQDFSDKDRMADCLKIEFTASVVTNEGDAQMEKVWTINGNYTMSMMSRGNKLETWK